MISQRTIKDVYNIIKTPFEDPFRGSFAYHGKLSVPDFLIEVIPNLRSKKPYQDNRVENEYDDISLHTVVNEDYSIDDVINFDRFPELLRENVFKKFIETMFNPAICYGKDISNMFNNVNDTLSNDGYYLKKDRKVGSDYAYVIESFGGLLDVSFKRIDANDTLQKKINLIKENVKINPDVSIGKSKELLESIFKTLLSKQGIDYESGNRVTNLTGLFKILKDNVLTKNVEKNNLSKKDELENLLNKSTISMLGQMSGIVQSISELRNKIGDGHGREVEIKVSSERCAELVANATFTIAKFIEETYLLRK